MPMPELHTAPALSRFAAFFIYRPGLVKMREIIIWLFRNQIPSFNCKLSPLKRKKIFKCLSMKMGVVKCLKMEKVKIPKSEGGVSTGSHSTKKEEDIHQTRFSAHFFGGVILKPQETKS